MQTPGLLLYFIIAILMSCPARAQWKFTIPGPDSVRVTELEAGLKRSFFQNADSTIYFSEQLISIAERNRNDTLWIMAKQRCGEGYRGSGQFSRSLKFQLDALQRSREIKNRSLEAYSYSFLGFTYLMSGFYRQCLAYSIPAFQILDSVGERIQASFAASNAASSLTQLGKTDSASIYNDISTKIWQNADSTDQRRSALRTLIFNRIAANFEAKSKLDSAIFYYRQSHYFASREGIIVNINGALKDLARIHLRMGHQDSAKYFALAATSTTGLVIYLQESALLLDSIYRKEGKPDSALFYQTIAMKFQDSLFGPRKVRELQGLMAAEQERQQQEEVARSATRSRQRMLLMAGALFALLTAVFILRRGNRIKQDLNGKLQEKNNDLEKTLSQLKATQAQLIQSEKMASLGELTAGIAHEIQNPLNFVNNFSDVNEELVAELLLNLQKGNNKEAEELAKELLENEKKINHHGKRADTIVKSMLQHSRASTGQKELTDINTLCDEYARLAYHGMRSRDPNFSLSLKTNLDPAVGKLNIIAQDIGRVLLNLINNAFYAVQEKHRINGKDYIPEVYIMTSVSTISNQDYIVITVQDNGIGVPEKIRQKIFQPFFTTKPTGEGTGLGLSLSFDIIRALGGQIQVHSQEGEGSEFEILLPKEEVI